MTFDSNILPQVLYQDQSIVDLIGDVICPNKKSGGKKSVYITSTEEINKSTYQCKQCKACSHVLNPPFKDQKPCVTLFGWIYCFRKKVKIGLRKEKLSPLMQQCISQSKHSTTKEEDANNEAAPKKAKILPKVSHSIGCFYYNINLLFSSISKFSPTDNTLFYNQHNAIYSLQQRNTVDLVLIQ